MDTTLDLTAAQFCELVYDDNAQGLLAHSVGEVIHCAGDVYGGDAYVFETEEYNWVVFRGADFGTGEFWRDLRTAFDAFWNRVGDVRLHRGFFKAWQEISAEVYEEIFSLRARQQWDESSAKKTIYCGHSSGGALATIAAGTHHPHALITFASPRVGNELLGEYLQKTDTVRRWVNGSDYVPRLPFGFGYKHHGEEYLVDKDGDVIVQPTRWQRFRELCLDFRRVRLNHRMSEYWWAVLGYIYRETK